MGPSCCILGLPLYALEMGRKDKHFDQQEKERIVLSPCHLAILLVMTQPMSFMVGLRLEKVDSNHLILYFILVEKKWVKGERDSILSVCDKLTYYL